MRLGKCLIFTVEIAAEYYNNVGVSDVAEAERMIPFAAYTAAVYAAKGHIHSAIMARHAIRPLVKNSLTTRCCHYFHT